MATADYVTSHDLEQSYIRQRDHKFVIGQQTEAIHEDVTVSHDARVPGLQEPLELPSGAVIKILALYLL